MTIDSDAPSALLGPIFHRWMWGIKQYCDYLDDGDAAFFFCARGGVQILDLFRQLFPQGTLSWEGRCHVMWASRLSICKGIFLRAPGAAFGFLEGEFRGRKIRDVVHALLKNHPTFQSEISSGRSELDAEAEQFGQWFTASRDPLAARLSEYLAECSLALDVLLDSKRRAQGRSVLVDTGWHGTIRGLLQNGFPAHDWRGLYFGRLIDNGLAIHSAAEVGLIFESRLFDQQNPATAFSQHIHLIESLMEGSGQSIEELPGGPLADIARVQIASNQASSNETASNPDFAKIKRYLQSNAALGLAEVVARYQSALAKVADILVTPTPGQVVAWSGGERCADVGRSERVPVVMPVSSGSRQERVQRSLWKQGQLALEYGSSSYCRAQQIQMACESVNSDLADAADAVPRHNMGIKEAASMSEDPAVAIVTRTKDRPLLLARAAGSVAAQSFKDFEWVVINDGGDPETAAAVIEQSAVDRRRITFLSNTESVGMEAASNLAISHSKSEFIVIHDDDDSWDPGFLECTVDFLRSEKGRIYSGVITRTKYISEKIINDEVVEVDSFPYNDWVRNIQLAEMACSNMFPPIAFLYKRSLWEKVGGYREKLPVLGDWYFNLEFLLHADIGVIDKSLANYHHRDVDSSTTAAYSNSVIGSKALHEEYASVVRNEFVRSHADSQAAVVSVLLGYGLERQTASSVVARERRLQPATKPDFDRLWCVTHLNLHLLRKWWLRLWPFSYPHLKVQAGWYEVEALIKRVGFAVPSPDDFDTYAYLKLYPDVEEAIQTGKLTTAYMHYIMHGRPEGRVRTAKS